MRWTTEARVLRLLDRLPGGSELHYQAQRRLVRSFPLSDVRFQREITYAREHLATLKPDFEGVRALEFGAGRHLTVAQAIAAEGAAVTAFDVGPLAKLELVRNAGDRLGRPLPAGGDVQSVLRPVGVDYRMMSANRFPGVEDGSVDLVYSTSVLEHVPRQDLPALLTECQRVLSRDGVASFIVDYKDHFVYGDRSITPWNFLSIPEADWFTRFSPAIHYQNRIRHYELVGLLEASGFSVHTEYLVEPDEDDIAWLTSTSLDAPFCRTPPEELGIGEAHVVATVR